MKKACFARMLPTYKSTQCHNHKELHTMFFIYGLFNDVFGTHSI
jgi:hypothetical protein